MWNRKVECVSWENIVFDTGPWQKARNQIVKLNLATMVKTLIVLVTEVAALLVWFPSLVNFSCFPLRIYIFTSFPPRMAEDTTPFHKSKQKGLRSDSSLTFLIQN